MTTQADASGIISSGQIADGTMDHPSTTYVYYTPPTTGALTLSLSYTGVTPGYADMVITMGGEHLTESTYGNPIVIKFNAAAHTSYLIGIGSSDGGGTYTLSYTLVDNDLPPTMDPFWSMPCFFTPLWDLPPGVGDTDLMQACPSLLTPDPNTAAPAAPSGFSLDTMGDSAVELSWQDEADSAVAGYRIYKGTSPDNLTYVATRPNPTYPGSAFWVQHPPGPNYFTTYDDTDLTPSTAYYYAIVAFTANNVSVPSRANTATHAYVAPTISNSSGGSTNNSAPSSGGSTSPSIPGKGTAPLPPVTAYLNIAEPVNGATISGVYQVWGEAISRIDNSPVTSVQIEIDNNGFVSTAGAIKSWFYVLNTRLYSNTTHTITVKVTTAQGTTKTTWTTVTFKNGSYAATAPTTQGTWISPEGMKIIVDSKGKNPHTGQPWTIADVYYMVRACAAGTGDFDKLAPGYTVNLNDKVFLRGLYYDYTVITSMGGGGNVWATVNATTYLNGAVSAMLTEPYVVACYEYGHYWTESYYYLVDYPSSSGVSLAWEVPPSYTKERWVNANGTITLAKEPYHCLNFIDSWDGCISDDRRILFGGPGANAGSTTADLVPTEPSTGYREPTVPYLVYGIIPPQNQPDLAAWYTDHWMTGK